jgi:tetratricopeptide (TPR) repeat protein
MAEGADAADFQAPGSDPFALHRALDSAGESAAARDYLERQSDVAAKQSRLLDLQIADLEREDKVRHWGVRVRHVSDVLKLGFELAVAFIGIVLAIGVAALIWQATQADGLVIETFNVPPSMVQKGLTGQVVASKLLDRLTIMQSETQSSRSPSSFSNDWTNDIKVEIPDTGVSLGEVVRFLNDALGHQMHLSGEMYESGKGAALTIRLDNDPGETFTSADGNLDKLMQRAAEAVFARAQPYRYSVYLNERGDISKALAADKTLAETGAPSERAWASVGLGNALQRMGRFEEARRAVLRGIQADPGVALPHLILANVEGAMSHEEAALTAAREADRQMRGKAGQQFTPIWRTLGEAGAKNGMFELTGDFRAAAGTAAAAWWLQPVYSLTERAQDLARAHDPVAAAALLSRLTRQQTEDAGSIGASAGTIPFTRAEIAVAREDWPGAARELKQAETEARDEAQSTHGDVSDRDMREIGAGPDLAVVLARLGDGAGADAVLKTLPADCDVCLRAHGRVEALRKHWSAAAHWFAIVSARSPEVPFADDDWGAMLLEKGDYDGAIAKFASAHKKGPHYADPLEYWGEALIARNRSDLALAKFEEAAKYAPNWGRLHLKWAEALLWSGDKAGAQKQFVFARRLDLDSAERAELSRMSRRPLPS